MLLSRETAGANRQSAVKQHANNLYRTKLEWMRREMPQARGHKAHIAKKAFYDLERVVTTHRRSSSSD